VCDGRWWSVFSAVMARVRRSGGKITMSGSSNPELHRSTSRSAAVAVTSFVIDATPKQVPFVMGT
jgi:hypothetical protein